MEKEKHDDSYPRGVIEESIRNQENGSSFPKDKPSGSQTDLSNPRFHAGISSSFPPLAVPRMCQHFEEYLFQRETVDPTSRFKNPRVRFKKIRDMIQFLMRSSITPLGRIYGG